MDKTRTRWTAERIARLGFLIGLHWDAKRVADDPLIASTPIMFTGRRNDSASPSGRLRFLCGCRPRRRLSMTPPPRNAVSAAKL